ncbi:segregation and condensation protein A [Desulfatitalea alkaliphila]|uniref:Segregation and condensation protein A n=1 Tax=Desulfatitalea alkaliphila TaxID=2929485 RepID=A0AA41R2Y5_9BACT|nr:segregation/condensation protein A [Desulfatitalea alkaliphila]MCJ8500766.1 segregation/condensation protein A [Desulfatitalea alkaliphila]
MNEINAEYKVKLDNVFEGPMDLLVHLIKKNEVDIYDIPVGLITEQYLAYLDWMKLLNIDIVGDFLVMASTLAQIKSRMLLPFHGDEDEEEDPRLEIARPLAEYLQIKSAAEELANRNMLGDKMFTRPAVNKAAFEGDQELIQVGLFELIDAFQRILEKASKDHVVDLSADKVSVKDRMNVIIAILEEKGSVAFVELFPAQPRKTDIIATFLALLELMRLNLVRAVQAPAGNTIRLFYQ